MAMALSTKFRYKFRGCLAKTKSNINRHETILFYQVNPLKLVTGMAIKYSSDTVNSTYALYSMCKCSDRIRMIYIHVYECVCVCVSVGFVSCFKLLTARMVCKQNNQTRILSCRFKRLFCSLEKLCFKRMHTPSSFK